MNRKKFRAGGGVAGLVQGVGHQGAVPGPDVGVGVPVEIDHVGVVGRQDAALPVDLGPDDQEAAAVELGHRFGQELQPRGFLPEPEAPVVGGAFEVAGGLLVFDQAVETQDVFPALAGGEPVVGRARFIGRAG